MFWQCLVALIGREMGLLVLSIVLVVLITLVLHALHLEKCLELHIYYFLSFVNSFLILILINEGGVHVHVH